MTANHQVNCASCKPVFYLNSNTICFINLYKCWCVLSETIMCSVTSPFFVSCFSSFHFHFPPLLSSSPWQPEVQLWCRNSGDNKRRGDWSPPFSSVGYFFSWRWDKKEKSSDSVKIYRNKVTFEEALTHLVALCWHQQTSGHYGNTVSLLHCLVQVHC